MSEKDITEPIKSMLKKEYDRGYQQAENDYYNQSEKDRQSSYDSGYQQGGADAIDECIKIAEESCWKDADMLIGYFKELKEHMRLNQ